MKRQIININQEKCNGCGICTKACHEGAIGIVNGKATLLRDDYCDGMGDCLPTCPTGAITFIEKDTLAYNKKAVEEKSLPCGCPGNVVKSQKLILTQMEQCKNTSSQLQQWPVQIKLVPIDAPYFKNSNLLIAADCTAYAYGNFHDKFIKNKITLIGCPKLDEGDYTEKLTEIISKNNILSLTVVKMEVPCCGGIERAAVNALKNSGKFIPWRVVTISTDGKILNE